MWKGEANILTLPRTPNHNNTALFLLDRFCLTVHQ